MRWGRWNDETIVSTKLDMTRFRKYLTSVLGRNIPYRVLSRHAISTREAGHVKGGTLLRRSGDVLSALPASHSAPHFILASPHCSAKVSFSFLAAEVESRQIFPYFY